MSVSLELIGNFYDWPFTNHCLFCFPYILATLSGLAWTEARFKKKKKKRKKKNRKQHLISNQVKP